MLGRTLHDITQLLESADGASERVRRVLELVRVLVPCDACAVLDVQLGYAPQVIVVPAPSADEQRRLTSMMVELFGHLVVKDPEATAPRARPDGAHLAVPLIGLDDVTGILLARSSVGIYTEQHVRVLALVAAKLAAYFTMLRARTELVELARERDEARQAAEVANRAKDELLALVSHGLRTPLGSMLAWTHLLRSPAADDASRAHAVAELEQNVEAQARLIDEILELACIASADMRLNLRAIEPAALIEATLAGLELEAERKSIQVQADLDATPMPLVVDPDRIGRVISILVANAIRFTPVGGQVQVRLERAGGKARIQVRDSGAAITPEALPRVFDRVLPARQGDARTAAGPGIGLAIVKDLIELHGGCVLAENAGADRGAIFTVELPSGLAARRARDGAHAEDRWLAGVHVLFVDQDAGLREAFQLVLEEHGAMVTAVGSAPDALEALERSAPNVLLLGDLATRGTIAADLMRDVRSRPRPLPAASVSAWPPVEQELAATSFQLHLTKPVDIGALLDAVARLAGRTRRHRVGSRP